MLKNMHVVEDALISKGRELSRRLLQGYLNNCGNGDVGKEVIASNPIRLTYKRLVPKTLQTFFGSVILHRIGYSNRVNSTIYPLDVFLNLKSTSFSYPLQKLLIREVAKGAIDEALQLVDEITGIKKCGGVGF
jgi:hypothetical protein